MNEIIIQKVNHLDTHKLKLLVEESSSEGFRHLKRLVNDFETGTNKFDKDGGFSVNFDSDNDSHFLWLVPSLS